MLPYESIFEDDFMDHDFQPPSYYVEEGVSSQRCRNCGQLAVFATNKCPGPSDGQDVPKPKSSGQKANLDAK